MAAWITAACRSPVVPKGGAFADLSLATAGDLVFWSGHVALASSMETIIHANAHHMAVVEEPVFDAVARIAATDTGSVTSILRPDRVPFV